MKPRAWSDPPNAYASTALAYLEDNHPRATVHVWEDATRTITATNDSPDVGFSYSVNPYPGCMHACAYCYARPGHEYLGFGAGTDFDTQVVVATRLTRSSNSRQSTVVSSNVTAGEDGQLPRVAMDQLIELQQHVVDSIRLAAPARNRSASSTSRAARRARLRCVSSSRRRGSRHPARSSAGERRHGRFLLPRPPPRVCSSLD